MLGTLPAFTKSEAEKVHLLLAGMVVRMGGRKLEEGDWASVYCEAKGIPNKGWSNLNIDVMHDGLGVEHKMIRAGTVTSIAECCGQTLMHPAATRSIRIESTKGNPDSAMRDVFRQYAELIERRTAKVKESSKTGRTDMRTGWLIWQDSLREFLYFEERTVAPNPDDYYAEWTTRRASGSRKGSTNLWVFSKKTKQKRFSITTEAGAKIQPYFDVPPLDDPNLYRFTVQGEPLPDDKVRLWVSRPTASELERTLGKLDAERISAAVKKASGNPIAKNVAEPEIVPLQLSREAYGILADVFAAPTDELRMQKLLRVLAPAEPMTVSPRRPSGS